MANYGVEVFRGRRWPTQMRVSGINAPAETWQVDPSLPPLGSDPRYPTSDLIVIPRGRLLAVRPDMHTAAPYSDEAYLTIADGSTNKPIGYTESNIFRKWPQRIQIRPVVSKQEFIVLPYVAAINALYGTLSPGDRITAYFGSVTSTVPNPMERGRIVKWVPRRAYHATLSGASSTVPLAAANLPMVQPRVIAAFNADGALLYPLGLSVSYSFSSGNWVATFSGSGAQNVKAVLYEWGQDVDQIAGEVVRIQFIDSQHLMHGWLQWVTDNYPAWDYPPYAVRVPTTDVSNETAPDLTYDASAGLFRLKHRPVAMWKPIRVEVSHCTIQHEDGSTQVVADGTWFQLPLADVPYANWTMGKWHVIDPFMGTLRLSSNIQFAANVNNPATKVRVSYAYETSYRDGRLWASGQMGITDGSGGSGLVGVPAHLDVPVDLSSPYAFGELRVIIY